MDRRWLVVGFALLFASLTAVFLARGEPLQTAIALVHTVTMVGLLWWQTAHGDQAGT
ncbi:hypothetical protein B4589_005120 [Halolamina sp. CBA1230]|uniref:hypothetical protein n=1 Tax=Halolamina sp. CBA1230 TaxID=1853690 RepID=UPI001301A7D7|nr:hypothetical protein [Halolamina sp. CBA1230]QKY19789.1 hypothetical protein B4589_005120 [Halolamina sp. CBA1230]